MSLHTSYHADSDADDEYERSVITSPHLQTDSEASPIDSDIPSSEHTPTKFGYSSEGPRTPRSIISDWTADECVEFLTSLGLLQYCGSFRGENISFTTLPAFTDTGLLQRTVSWVRPLLR
jgi:hypothetical protein